MAGELTDLSPKKIRHMDKSKLAMVGIGFLTLVVTWMLYRRSQAGASQAAAVPVSSGPVDPATGLPYSSNPGGNFGATAATPDWSALTTNINALIAQEGSLMTVIGGNAQPPGAQSSPGPGSWQAPVSGTQQSAAAAIYQDYEQLLGRAPEQQGLQGWLGLYNQGTSLDVIQKDIANSPEALAYAVKQEGGYYQPPTAPPRNGPPVLRPLAQNAPATPAPASK